MTRNLKFALTAGCVASALVTLSVNDARGLRKNQQQQADIAVLKDKQRVLVLENEALRREINALSGDNRALERAAREDLGLIRAREVVYSFER